MAALAVQPAESQGPGLDPGLPAVDAGYGNRGLLVRNLERLPPGQLAKVMDTLMRYNAGQQVLAARLAKGETPRRASTIPANFEAPLVEEAA